MIPSGCEYSGNKEEDERNAVNTLSLAVEEKSSLLDSMSYLVVSQKILEENFVDLNTEIAKRFNLV